MTATRYVSPCCGAECEQKAGMGRFNVPGLDWYCSACGQPCAPMPAYLRDRIVAEGMRRAAFVCAQKSVLAKTNNHARSCEECSEAIYREADRLEGK